MSEECTGVAQCNKNCKYTEWSEWSNPSLFYRYADQGYSGKSMKTRHKQLKMAPVSQVTACMPNTNKNRQRELDLLSVGSGSLAAVDAEYGRTPTTRCMHDGATKEAQEDQCVYQMKLADDADVTEMAEDDELLSNVITDIYYLVDGSGSAAALWNIDDNTGLPTQLPDGFAPSVMRKIVRSVMRAASRKSHHFPIVFGDGIPKRAQGPGGNTVYGLTKIINGLKVGKENWIAGHDSEKEEAWFMRKVSKDGVDYRVKAEGGNLKGKKNQFEFVGAGSNLAQAFLAVTSIMKDVASMHRKNQLGDEGTIVHGHQSVVLVVTDDKLQFTENVKIAAELFRMGTGPQIRTYDDFFHSAGVMAVVIGDYPHGDVAAAVQNGAFQAISMAVSLPITNNVFPFDRVKTGEDAEIIKLGKEITTAINAPKEWNLGSETRPGVHGLKNDLVACALSKDAKNEDWAKESCSLLLQFPDNMENKIGGCFSPFNKKNNVKGYWPDSNGRSGCENSRKKRRNFDCNLGFSGYWHEKFFDEEHYRGHMALQMKQDGITINAFEDPLHKAQDMKHLGIRARDAGMQFPGGGYDATITYGEVQVAVNDAAQKANATDESVFEAQAEVTGRKMFDTADKQGWTTETKTGLLPYFHDWVLCNCGMKQFAGTGQMMYKSKKTEIDCSAYAGKEWRPKHWPKDEDDVCNGGILKASAFMENWPYLADGQVMLTGAGNLMPISHIAEKCEAKADSQNPSFLNLEHGKMNFGDEGKLRGKTGMAKRQKQQEKWGWGEMIERYRMYAIAPRDALAECYDSADNDQCVLEPQQLDVLSQAVEVLSPQYNAGKCCPKLKTWFHRLKKHNPGASCF